MADSYQKSSEFTCQCENKSLILTMAAKLRMNSLILGEDPETIEMLNKVSSKYGSEFLNIVLCGVSLPDISYSSTITIEIFYPSTPLRYLFTLSNKILDLFSRRDIDFTPLHPKALQRLGGLKSSFVYQFWYEYSEQMSPEFLIMSSMIALEMKSIPKRYISVREIVNYAPEINRGE